MFEIIEEAESEKPFGDYLSQARQTLGLTLDELAKSLKLNVKILEALENSDIESLPPAIYVQGYIKAYAKALGISDEEVHQKYLQSVADKQSIQLQPRSSLPSEINSESPMIKMLSVAFGILIVLTMIFGIYRYYSEKVSEIHDSRAETAANEKLVIPELTKPVEQKKIIEISEPAIEKPKTVKLKKEVIQDRLPENNNSDVTVTDIVDVKIENATEVKSDTAEQEDTLMLRATAESWAEIRDKSKARIYFNMLEPDDFVILHGSAPFDIFLGNALHVNIAVNDIDVDMSNFIRANNVAHFTVSEKSNQIVFH